MAVLSFRTTLMTVALAASLAGCGSVPDSGPICPQVGIVADAAHLVRFAPGHGVDASDIALEGDVGRITGDCRYNKERTETNVDLTVTFAFKRGPAGAADAAAFAYFAAVLDGKNNILAREEFTSPIDFKGGDKNQDARATVSEELVQHVPLPAGADGAGYQILVGFKLTAEEVARARAGSVAPSQP